MQSHIGEDVGFNVPDAGFEKNWNFYFLTTYAQEVFYKFVEITFVENTKTIPEAKQEGYEKNI